MRRKRRNRGTWIPVLGHTESSGDAPIVSYNFADFRIPADTLQVFPNPSNGGPNVFGPFPLVPDFTFDSTEEGAAAQTLHDRVQGNAWTLQRIVGKVHLSLTAGGAPGGALVVWNNAYVTVGFLVARSIDDAQESIDLFPTEVDAQNVDNVRNPWIWRRSWILGNPSGDGQQWNQRSTADYGSLADGPHIDSKSKRFINADHRLWCVVNARGYDPRTLSVTGNNAQQPFVSGLLDIRIFGALRRQKNTSAF